MRVSAARTIKTWVSAVSARAQSGYSPDSRPSLQTDAESP